MRRAYKQARYGATLFRPDDSNGCGPTREARALLRIAINTVGGVLLSAREVSRTDFDRAVALRSTCSAISLPTELIRRHP